MTTAGSTPRQQLSQKTANLFVRAGPSNRCRGMLRLGGMRFPCALGRGGPSRRKAEGDGATPAGRFALQSVLYRADRVRRPLTALPVRAIRPCDGWCDAAGNANYNRPVRLPYPASHEMLWRDDHLYDIVVILDYNIVPRRHGAGSAIFFHLAHHDFRPTEGCVAVQQQAMRTVLAAIGTNTVMDIA